MKKRWRRGSAAARLNWSGRCGGAWTARRRAVREDLRSTMADVPEETIDRLLAGELPAAEQRRIAQAALDDPDLFEQLTAAGVVTNSVDAHRETAPSAVPNKSSAASGSPWTRPRVVVMTMIAAAAAILLAVAIGSSRS